MIASTVLYTNESKESKEKVKVDLQVADPSTDAEKKAFAKILEGAECVNTKRDDGSPSASGDRQGS